MDELEKARARRRRRRRERQMKKSKVQWGRLVIAVVLALSVICGIGWGLYSGVSYVYHRITNTDTAATIEESSDPKHTDTVSVEQKALDKPVYVLIVGKDKNNPSQADSLFLMSINMNTSTMDIIGIPSNSKIESRDQKSVSMLNQMYADGGIELTKAVVEDVFHISIPYYVVVDETAFRKTSDVLGDQQFYVEKNMEHVDAETGNKDIDLRRGYQNLDSDKALAYLRYADEHNDNFSRVQRQERFLKLWVEREQNRFFLTKAWHIWRLWSHYESNISTWDAIKLMRSISQTEKDHIHFYILPGEKEKIDNIVYWHVNPTEAQRLVGITMGTLSPQDMSQFVSAPVATKEKVAVESEQGTRAKPSEPGSEAEKKE